MRVGMLRIPFSLFQESVSGSWENVTVLWGGIRAVKNGEDGTHEIVMRKNDDLGIESGMRLVWGDRKFLVLEVVKIEEMERFLKLRVREVRELG